MKRKPQKAKPAKALPAASAIEKALELIRKNPGIRPSELNRMMNREESDGLRASLIKRGLIKKKRDGSATRYYAVYPV